MAPHPKVAAKAVEMLLEVIRDHTEPFNVARVIIERGHTDYEWIVYARDSDDNPFVYAIYFDSAGTYMEADGF